MAKDHELGLEALNAYLQGKPEPANGFRSKMPPPGWGHALAAGSANIPLMICVAAYLYDLKAGKRSTPRERLVEYLSISKELYMLAESLGVIYAGWTVHSWLVALAEAKAHGDEEIYSGVRELFEQYLAICRLHDIPSIPRDGAAFPVGTSTVYPRLGKRGAGHPGHRSWGFRQGFNFPHHSLWGVANGEQPERLKAESGFTARAQSKYRALIREIAAPILEAPTNAAAIELVPQLPLRAPFEVWRWADGSFFSFMGRVESPEAPADWDANGNTPAFIAFLYDAKRQLARGFPEHPDPLTGQDRLRQTNCAGCVVLVDGRYEVWHSHFGRIAGEWKRTPLELPEGDPVEIWRLPNDRQGWSDALAKAPMPEPAPEPAPAPAPAPAKKRSKVNPWVIVAALAAIVALAYFLGG